MAITMCKNEVVFIATITKHAIQEKHKFFLMTRLSWMSLDECARRSLLVMSQIY